MSKKPCVIHYRKLRRSTFPDKKTLGAAISEAMNAQHPSGDHYRRQWAVRVSPVPRSPDTKRFINNFDDNEAVVFGTLCNFTPGEMQALLAVSPPDAEEELDLAAVDIEENTAPAGREYLHGIGYWLVINDHFLMIPHSSVTPKSMEEYLTWLLRDTKVIGTGHFVELQAEFDASSIGGIKNVKSIEIGGTVPGATPEAESKDVSVEVVERSVIGAVQAMWAKAPKVLELVLGEMEAKKLMDSMPPDAHLDVTVNIGYRARKRKIKKEFLDNLASGLRNLPDGEVLIRGADSKIHGSDARLQTTMSVKRLKPAGSLLDLKDARDQMIKVYKRFLEDGKIIA